VVRRTLAVALAGLAILAAGCGGKDEDPAEAWVNGVCSSFTTWADDVQGSVDSLTAGTLSKDSLQAAADDVKSSTETLQSDLKDLGAPKTDAGEQAQEQVTGLTDQLAPGQQTIESALADANGVSGTLAAAGAAATALSAMAAEVTTTFDDLKKLDPGGELQTAFEQSSECEPVREQLDKLNGS